MAIKEFQQAYKKAISQGSQNSIWPHPSLGGESVVPVFYLNDNPNAIARRIDFGAGPYLAKQKLNGELNEIKFDDKNKGFLAGAISRTLDYALKNGSHGFTNPMPGEVTKEIAYDRIDNAIAGMSFGNLNNKHFWNKLENIANQKVEEESLRPYILSKMQEYQVNQSTLK